MSLGAILSCYCKPHSKFLKKNILQVLVSKSAGKYCVGDQITMADCFLVPQVYNAYHFKVDMKQFPNINTIVQNLEKVNAFITTIKSPIEARLLLFFLMAWGG